jgi:hypothetical protein
MYPIRFYAYQNATDHLVAWLIANAASCLPEPVLIGLGRRIDDCFRRAARPRLRRVANRLTIIVVGDGISIRIMDRGK